MRPSEAIARVQNAYLADSRPWVIGFSGGKDSTATLQLVWSALERLPAGSAKKPVYILSSNTLVESPLIVRYIGGTLKSINEQAVDRGLPISASLVEPIVEESFWVNVIGRGYPAPSTKFRWCTDRLKISPANRFIKDQVARFGEVVLVLGVRKAESATRAQVMALHEIDGSEFRTHSTLSGALVFAPIENWSTDDVWGYLLQNPRTQWGSDNNDLAAMYRTADGECPLVVDTTTPSCGSSRFGCWVCTVVTRDKSMQAMVDAGLAPWMEQLLEIRDFLADTQVASRKRETRSIRKLDGRILLKDSGDEAAFGPYRLEFCKELLERLLRIQTSLPPEAGDISLISDEELVTIRKFWREQRNDWEDSVPKIYERVTAKRWFSLTDTSSSSEDDAEVIRGACEKHGVPSLLLRRLLDAERRASGMRRRVGIYDRLSSILDEDWRSDEQVAHDIAVLGS
ncbi:MAG TPA: DNA phosphorothioation system sulfurtransferase DndC [Candidatus Rubrimentiphilum sp.]|nr:DNA phosphorothioation system sulfurtransferase DndC [Candidatus Rubrimentiphilum sp.]